MGEFERYWLFLGFCLVVTLLLMRLVLRERITLQGSLSYLVFLVVLLVFAAFPDAAAWVAESMGFTLLSNFFFAVTAGMFALLHLAGLIAHSKAEFRTITLVQELAIMNERLDAMSAALAANTPAPVAPERPAATDASSAG